MAAAVQMQLLPCLAVLAVLAVCLPSTVAGAAVDAEDPFAVPEGLLIGAGTSAFQTEGSWQADGKGESAADRVLHSGKMAGAGFGSDTHDVAADSYRRYKEDVQAAADLGLKLYRFSISWARMMPDAVSRNDQAVQHYHDVIDEVLKHNMVPLVTLYHFDHPWVLEEQFKGWQSGKMVNYFKEYARLVFTEYGSKVKLWATVNEANMYCTYFPRLFLMANLYTQSDMDHYACMRNTALGHAEAYHLFKELGLEGQVGFSAALSTARPRSTRPEDVYASNAFNQFSGGMVLAPVTYGDYPQIVKELAGSKLQPFSQAESERLKGTMDFIAFNVYYGMTANYDADATAHSIYFKAPIIGLYLQDTPFVNLTLESDLMDPDALRTALLWTWNEYKVPLIVSENGYGDASQLGTKDRIRGVYFSAFLRTLVTTMKEYSIKVIGYCAWSLIDSYEWSAGYSKPYGLVHIDYAGGTQDRSMKDSSQFWVELAKTGSIPLWEDKASSATAASSAASAALLLLLALAVNLL
ncbi:myrosinase 1-like isoform X2 [Thrips palmi]|uniref:Myrosinase 1-like isoform X2 n=1 Tax=Thrips palmi TaxID=161013 RepID=A0A6P8ZY64_THRPL|nr:myrosinase 1-like isoform X2 [Thrips palmi]